MMTETPTECPPIPRLQAYALGRLPDEDSDIVFEHLSGCASCAAELETIDDGEDSLIVELRQPDPLAEFGEEPDCQVAVAKALGALASANHGLTATGDLEFPRQIGEYEIVRPLGRGGMGNVYLARHTKLGREVALKVLATHRLADSRMRQRFDAEMRAVGGLSHPNIVTAHDARDIDGTAVLVTEFIDGADLGKVVQLGGPLSIADSCEIIRKIAVALAYTDSQGFVHRDVKPSNIMLSRTGEVKLLDLGLARFQFSEPDHPEITGTGQTMGTADYVAPEQVTDSRSVDIRADVYSLGCTLMKLLTGFAPFADNAHQTPFAKMTAHVSTPPPRLSDRFPQAPKELAALVDSMLQKDPDKRPQTPMEVADRLAKLAIGSDLKAVSRREVIAPPPQQTTSPSSTNPATKSVLARRVPLSIAIAAGFLGVLFGLILGILIKIKYPDGTTVEVDIPVTPGAQVAIEQSADTPAKHEIATSARPAASTYEPMLFVVLLEESDISSSELAAAKKTLVSQVRDDVTSVSAKSWTWIRLADDLDSPIVETLHEKRFALASRNQRISWSELNGHILSATTRGMGGSGSTIDMNFDETLTQKLQKLTAENLNRPLAVIVDNEIIVAPVIRSEIRAGRISLAGIKSPDVVRFIMQCVDGGLVDPIKRDEKPIAASIDKQIEGIWLVNDPDLQDSDEIAAVHVIHNGRWVTMQDRKLQGVASYALNQKTTPTQIDVTVSFPDPEVHFGVIEVLPSGELHLNAGRDADNRPHEFTDDSSLPSIKLRRVGNFPVSPQDVMKAIPILGVELTNLIVQLIQMNSMPMEDVIGIIRRKQTAIDATTSNNALKRMGLAFHNFHDVFAKFPGSKNLLEGSRGTRATPPYPFSWRVAILPFIEHNELFEQYRFDEPWDSEHNTTLLERMPELYRSPLASKKQPNGETNFMGFATEQGALGIGDGNKMRSFTDGTTNTLLLVETSKSVPWTKPEDLTDTDVQPIDGQPLRYLTSDGSVKSMEPIDKELLQKLITRNGGETVR